MVFLVSGSVTVLLVCTCSGLPGLFVSICLLPLCLLLHFPPILFLSSRNCSFGFPSSCTDLLSGSTKPCLTQQSAYNLLIRNKGREFALFQAETRSFKLLSHSCFGSSALVVCVFPIHPF